PEVAVQQYRWRVGYAFTQIRAQRFDGKHVVRVDQSLVARTAHLRQQAPLGEEVPAVNVGCVVLRRVAAETVVVESEMRADDGMLSREPGARPLPIVGCALAVAEILHHDPVVCYLEHFGYAQRIGIAQRRESARFGTKEIGGGGMPRLHDRAAAIGQRDVLQSVEGRTTQGEYAHVEGT